MVNVLRRCNQAAQEQARRRGALAVAGGWSETVKATGAWVGSEPIHTVTNGTTEVTLVDLAASGNIRKLQGLSVRNATGANVSVTIYADDETNERFILQTNFGHSMHLHITDNGQVYILDQNGLVANSFLTGQDKTVLTEADETVTFPNSRRLVEGTAIDFNTGSPGELVISVINAAPATRGAVEQGDAVGNLTITMPADTPADADALRDDLVTNAPTEIQTKINDLLAELRQSGVIAT